MTMVDSRTTYARDISKLLIENYGSRVWIFNMTFKCRYEPQRYQQKEQVFISMIQMER